VVVARLSPRKRSTDVECVIRRYLRKNMRSSTGFVGVVEGDRFNEDFLRQKVFLRFDLTTLRKIKKIKLSRFVK